MFEKTIVRSSRRQKPGLHPVSHFRSRNFLEKGPGKISSGWESHSQELRVVRALNLFWGLLKLGIMIEPRVASNSQSCGPSSSCYHRCCAHRLTIFLILSTQMKVRQMGWFAMKKKLKKTQRGLRSHPAHAGSLWQLGLHSKGSKVLGLLASLPISPPG